MLMFLLISSFVLAACAMVWRSSNLEAAWYLSFDDSAKNAVYLLYTFLTTVCLNSTFIPISLIISLELVKVLQAWFISVDVELIGVHDDG